MINSVSSNLEDEREIERLKYIPLGRPDGRIGALHADRLQVETALLAKLVIENLMFRVRPKGLSNEVPRGRCYLGHVMRVIVTR
jgi:hypothetical protein